MTSSLRDSQSSATLEVVEQAPGEKEGHCASFFLLLDFLVRKVSMTKIKS